MVRIWNDLFVSSYTYYQKGKQSGVVASQNTEFSALMYFSLVIISNNLLIYQPPPLRV